MTTEDIASNWKLSETKQRSLGRAHETLLAQADSMVRFSVQWKDLEDHFDSIRNSLHTQFQELKELEKQTGSRLAHLEAKESNFNSEMASKAKELQGIVQEVEEGKTQLLSLKSSIELKENRLETVHKLVKGLEFEYANIQKRIEERPILLRDIESKKRQLNAVQVKVEEKWKEFDLIDEKIRVKQTLIEKYDTEVKSKEEKLGSLQKLVEEHLNAFELKRKDFWLLEKSMEEWAYKLELKDMELKRQTETVEREFESNVEEVNVIDKRVNDCLNEVQDYNQKQISKQKTDVLQSQVKIEQLEHIPDRTSLVPSTTGNRSSISRDGRSLQLFMNNYFRRTDFVSSKVSDLLQVSSDPAKLVLDAMQGFYPSNSTVQNTEFDFDLSVIRRSCIHLLKELKRVSPEINHQVREEVNKLAGDWKAKMTVAPENWLEVLGFLWLLTAYGLTSTYDPEELKTLLDIAAEPERSAELCGILDIADKTPVNSIICTPIKTEKPESSLGNNAATCSSPNVQPTASTEARNLQGFPNEHLSGTHLTQNGILQIATYALASVLNGDGFVKLLGMISQDKQALEYCQRFGLGDKVPDVVRNLIESKQLIEAVKIICTFNLIHEFPPVPLLKEHVENARKCSMRICQKKKSLDEKDKVVDDQIADLKVVIQCIKEYNLESEFPSSDIEMKIDQLQKVKKNWRHSAACAASKVKQEQRKGKKRSTSTFTPNFHSQQPKSKRQMTAVSAATPNVLPVPTTGHPGDSSTAARVKDISKGNCHHCNELGHWKRNCPRYLSEKNNLGIS